MTIVFSRERARAGRTTPIDRLSDALTAVPRGRDDRKKGRKDIDRAERPTSLTDHAILTSQGRPSADSHPVGRAPTGRHG